MISAPWYLLSQYPLWKHVIHPMYIVSQHDKFYQVLMDFISFYTSVLNGIVISPVLLSFFFLGLISFLIFDKRWKVLLFLIIWFFPAYFVIATLLLPNRDPRYLVPGTPALAILTIGGIDALPRRAIKRLIYIAIFTIGFIQFSYFSFFMPVRLFNVGRYFLCHPPIKEDWKIKDILISISRSTGKRDICVGVLPDMHYFNPVNFELYAKELKLPFSVKTFRGSRAAGRGDTEALKDYDIFITKSPPIDADTTLRFRDEFYEKFNERGCEEFGFIKLKEFMLPDNSNAVVYKRRENN